MELTKLEYTILQKNNKIINKNKRNDTNRKKRN